MSNLLNLGCHVQTPFLMNIHPEHSPLLLPKILWTNTNFSGQRRHKPLNLV